MHHATVVEIGGDDEACPTRTRVAVHKDSFSHFIETGQILAYHKHVLVLWSGQIYPRPVEGGDAMRLKSLRVVREADRVVDAVAAHRVLPWLLQIDYDTHLQVLHLLDHVMLLYEAVAWALRSDQFALNHVRVKALDGERALALLPLLPVARLAEAESALKAVNTSELDLLKARVHGTIFSKGDMVCSLPEIFFIHALLLLCGFIFKQG